MTKASVFARLQNVVRVHRLRRSGCIVGNNVKLGRHIAVTKGVAIGDGTSIDDGAAFSGSVQIGKNCHIEKLVQVIGNVRIGDESVVGRCTYLSTMPTGQIEIGRDVLVNSFSVIGAAQRVEIGNHCIFAAYVQITDATHSVDEPETLIKHAPLSSSPIIIGENVWLGSAVMVMMGTKIGDGAVVGAKSLVNKNIPAMSVAYGTPARVVRERRSSKASA